MELTKNRAELAVLRGKRAPEHLALWVQAFAEGDEALAERYALAVATFLGDSAASGEEWASYVGRLSPRTREAYAFAVTEFFEWAARKHGQIVPPHKVMRKDAEDYANWLSNRPFSLTEEKLNDFDQERRRTIYETVTKVGPADRRSIYGALPAAMKPAYTLEHLTHTLGRMVLHDLLDRNPTLSQVRVEHPRAGIDQSTIMVPGPDPEGPWVPMELADVFQYSIPRPRGVSRSTIALRLSALSTFWDVLAQGENVPGGQAILQHNIFKSMKKRVTRGLSSERKASSAARRMDPSLVPRLLNAANMAKTLPEKRDKALLYFLVFTGSRLSEAVGLRRGEPPPSEVNRWPGWFVGNTEPPVVRVRRKGGKLQTLPFPPIALRALADFQADLDRRSAPLSAQSSDPQAPHYLHPHSPRWRYRELARASDAPLFPPVHFWGANSTQNYQEFRPNAPNTYGPPNYRRSLTKAGVYQLLARLAHRAGLVRSEVEQVHPHGLRHFAATAMAMGGKDLREIQAILGHGSVTTTEGYLADVESVVALSGQAEILEYLSKFEGAAEAVPPPPPHEPKAPPRREVVETYGIPAPEAPSRAPREQEPQVPGQLRPRPPKPPKKAKEAPLAPPPVAPPPAAVQAASPPPAAETAAVQEVAPAYVAPEQLPLHTVATVPHVAWPEVASVQTASGRVTVYRAPEEPAAPKLVAVEGEPVPPEAKAEIALNEIRDKQSPCPTDDLYDAMERGDQWERIEFTMTQPRRRPKDNDLVTIDLSEKGNQVVQIRNKGHDFLATFYDPWPQNYGLGTVSLLPWFTKGHKHRDGRVTTKDDAGNEIAIPPLPVLSPEQVYAETTGTRVLDGLEALYGLWLNGDPAQGIPPSPSRTFGLVRWYGFFAHTTGTLQAYLRDKKKEYDRISRSAMGEPVPNVPTWVAWNVLATVGKNVRAHKDEWVLAWFRENAHTFTTTLRAYNKVERGEAAEGSETLFRRAFESVTAESVALRTTLPEWFAEEDPVHAIYKRDPKEWEAFATWLANITGQKLGAQRRAARADAAEYAEKSWEEKRDEAQDLLRQHVEAMEKLRFITLMLAGRRPVMPEDISIIARTGEVDDLKSEKTFVEWERAEIVKALNALGMPDPLALAEVRKAEQESDAEAESDSKIAEAEAKAAGVDVSELKSKPSKVRLTKDRIRELVKQYFPAPPEEENANLLRSSPLFDARLFNIDYKSHTISHTPEYREAFAEQYDDRDSELVMRRTARAMWEHAKTYPYLLQPPEEREPKKRKEGYSALYAVMLCYIAWVVPAPEEMERQAVASGRVRKLGPEARKDYLASHAQLLYELAYGRKPEPKLELTAKQAQEERVAYVMRVMAERGTPRTEAEVRSAWESFDVANVIFGEAELSPEAQSAEIGKYLGAEGFMMARATREQAEAERAEERKERRVKRPKKGKVAEAAPEVEVAWVAPKLKEGERVMATGVLKRAGKLTANAGAAITFEYLTNEAVTDWYCIRCEFLPPDGKRYMANKGTVTYVSPGAMAHKRRFLVNAQGVLPSPLVMIAAMNLAAVEA